MQTTVKIISCLFAVSIAVNIQAADKSCADQIGDKRARILVRHCISVSPATHPPCNAANSCELIKSEIARGCNLFTKDDKVPDFCQPKQAKSETLTGALIAGGGIDDYTVSIQTKNGRQIEAYCNGHCGDWFSATGEGETVELQALFKGKVVKVNVASERNGVRIAGPSENEQLMFIKSIRFIEK